MVLHHYFFFACHSFQQITGKNFFQFGNVFSLNNKTADKYVIKHSYPIIL